MSGADWAGMVIFDVLWNQTEDYCPSSACVLRTLLSACGEKGQQQIPVIAKCNSSMSRKPQTPPDADQAVSKLTR